MIYKYEREAEQRISEQDWAKEFQAWKKFGATDEQAIKFTRADFLYGTSAALKASFDKHYRITEEGVIRITEHKDPGQYFKENTQVSRHTWGLPTMEMPWITSDGEDGLYFVGMIGMNPEGEAYYLVKVGQSKDIKKRIAGYASMNPMIFHNNMYITEFNRDLPAESNCHRYLAENAYAIADRTEEWFYVTEEKYYELCGIFSDKEMFRAIAEGRD